MQLGIILMPDENREALQTILAFLRDFAVMSNENQVIDVPNVLKSSTELSPCQEEIGARESIRACALVCTSDYS